MRKLQWAPYKTENWEHIARGPATWHIKRHFDDHKLALAELEKGRVAVLECSTHGRIRLKPDGRRTRE